MHTSIPAAISRDVLSPCGVVSVEPLPSGMSGARVYRCLLSSGERRVLRRWPEGTDADRIAEVVGVMQHARENGCTLTPRLYPVGAGGQISHWVGETCWQLLEWMPGQPLAADATLDLVQLGAAAITRFHASTADLGVLRQPAGAIRSRLKRVSELKPEIDRITEIGPQAVIKATDQALAAIVSEARQLLIWHWDAVAQKINQDLGGFLNEPLHTQYVLRDIHRENAFFVEGQPSGLVDFDAVRVDTPWTDLARWTSGFLGRADSDEHVWQAAMAGFCRDHALNSGPEMDFGLRLAQRLVFATTWISLANWLVWLILEGREFDASSQQIATRIEQLRRLADLDI